MAARPHIFTIQAGIPFARALAEGLIAREGADPLLLADALILVPTRRAARALREIFAGMMGGAALLPRIRALGDVEGEEDFIPLTDDLALAPAIAPLRRTLLLATLVRTWGADRGHDMPFAQAVGHAEELARFLDEAVTQGADLTMLRTLAPEAFAAHWENVLAFLAIVAEQWPRLLAAEGAMEPAARRDAQLRALAAALTAHPPDTPIIAAGSTGSIPATAELLKAIAYLPRGAVVLPGLDATLDAESWDSLEPAHAQYGLREVLRHIGAAREDVASWTARDDAPRLRVRFLAEALRPPPTTDSWRDLAANRRAEFIGALDGFALVEAQNPPEEALVIACALREALSVGGKTAALVTPDRNLARRVAAELRRWDVAIDDSAGRKLSRLPAGAFLSLLARACAEDFAPVPLLALLKHPLAADGEERAPFRRRVRALELQALRGLPPEPGLEGLTRRLARKGTPELQRWFARVAARLAPFAAMMDRRDATLDALARAHGEAAEALAASDTETGAHLLWRKEDGEAAAGLLAELMRAGTGIALETPRHYADLFRGLAEARAVRPRTRSHPRLAILGPLEARLLDFDLVVLGGLNEGTWPADSASDPWLSRPMRTQLGLEPPERRIGLAAHDFATLSAARAVLLTRALKEDGAPSVASRWLLRVKQLARGLGIEEALAARGHLLHWARSLDKAPPEPRIRRPAPRPPVSARPRRLRVTEIETWLRDPYAIYARHVLGLKPLDPLNAEPGPAERGTAIHKALERFLRAFPGALPDDALAQLMRFGDEAFAQAGASMPALALWRPRYMRAARWFLDYERARRAAIAHSAVEIVGALEIAAPGGPFTLSGRADRVDFTADGAATILDYKTGRVPSNPQIAELLAPQLPLEGAMLLQGALGDRRATSLAAFVHLKLTGGEPPGEEIIAKVDTNAIATEALARLKARIAAYDHPDHPYLSRAVAYKTSDTGDYDHLARVCEWSRAGDESDSE